MKKKIVSSNREEKIKAEQKLITEALSGDQKAYKKLLEQYKTPVFHVIFKIVHNKEEADDLVQETFMKAFCSLATYKKEYRFTTWLYKIAANSSIDFLRKRKLEAFSLDEPVETKDGERGMELPDLTYSPEKDFSYKQKLFSIDQAIDSLPKKYKEVIVYRHKQDKPYEEIAEILKIPVGTVKARIFRARELLKKKLKSLR
jgi:RNA polymerase sigma-70 factor (ECF subfamily)